MQYYGRGYHLCSGCTTLVQTFQEWSRWSQWFALMWKTTRNWCQCAKKPDRKESKIDHTKFWRTTLVLSHCSGNTLEWIGKNMEIWCVLVPRVLSHQQLQNRVDACMSLITSHHNFQWLSNLITGDEKWVMYANHTRKRQWLGLGQPGVETPLPEPHPKKVMISVWWGVNGIIHWETLPTGCTITADSYCQQLERVAEKLKGKQDLIYFLHDNARPHAAKSTRRELLELGWKTINHPPYSPDLAPTDYHMIRSLSHHLSGKIFDNEEDLKNGPGRIFQWKDKRVLRARGSRFARTLEAGHRQWWCIHQWKTVDSGVEKYSRKEIQENEKTFLPT